MVLIFTQKNKRVTDESEDDVSIGRHALSPDPPTLMAELDELPQLRDYPAAKCTRANGDLEDKTAHMVQARITVRAKVGVVLPYF